MTPKISVCIDSYNYGPFLAQAIESVLQQTFPDFELIIADDCSTDESPAIAQEFARTDRRITVAVAPANLGMVRNRNACLRLARGEYVKWLHADDFLCSNDALGKMAAVLDQNHAISLVASARKIVDEKGRELDTWSSFQGGRPIAGTTVIRRCLFEQRNLIGGPSAVMFRRDLAARGFDESFFVMADLEMWFHLLEQGCFAYIREPLCAIRAHARQQTERDKRSLAPALENRELLNRYLHRSYVRLRRWIWKYIEYDAVRRLVRRARKLGLNDPRIDQAVQEWGGWNPYRLQFIKYRYRETLLKVRRVYERHLRRPLPRKSKQRPFGINVAGFVQSVYGIGESSRAYWRAVQATGLPAVLLNIRNKVHRNSDTAVTDFAATNPYRINLMTFSFDYARRFRRDMGRRFFADRYNIGLWFWEQEHFPLRWHSAFDYYDEIWVPTDFVRRAIAAVSPIPVHQVMHPLYLDDCTASPDRARFGLPADSFLFVFNFDFFSTVERKNPGGLIAAFRRAFRPDERVHLVLKTINAEHEPAARSTLARQANGANIIWIDNHVTRLEMNSLLASADCYVSLHRSEGLGLGMAEAMFLGKPVIATNYSGNLDFMDATNSLLVDYDMTELDHDAGNYERGSRWAEPRIEHAAKLMRFVFENPEQAKALGSRAATTVRAKFDPSITASQIVERIAGLR